MSLGSAITARRSVEIAVRTAHIGAMALLVGGSHLGAASASLRPWLLLTVATGVALLVTEATHSRHWVYQTRGILTLLHVAVLSLIAASPGLAGVALAAALIIGSIGSHLPRTLRKWSFRHRRIVD